MHQKKKFKREKIIPKHIDDCWSIDLIDVNNASKYNKGFKFILSCIDNFSKYSWAIPLKNKSSISVTEAFKSILSSGRKPRRVWCDQGKEFFNKDFIIFPKSNDIELYHTYSELKAFFVERFNRTLRDLLKVPVFVEGKADWLSIISSTIEKYNNRKHSTKKMTPVEGSKKMN